MPHGFMGKILWVNLTTGEITTEEVGEGIYRQFLGGYGLGAKILFDRMPAGAHPLGPENILGFVPGLLTGSGIQFTGRYMVVGKSPLTGGWGDANSGGFFGPELKKCGYDGVFVVGQSPYPVYLWLHDGEAEIRDASHLWGKDTYETEDTLRQELGDKIRVACIGPAGEKMSLLAGIFNDRGRTAARSGLGAVMGSKKLKAIACKGHLNVTRANPELFKQVNQFISLGLKTPNALDKALLKYGKPFLPLMIKFMGPYKPTVGQTVQAMSEQGTTSTLAMSVECGDSPVKNWAGSGVKDFPWSRSSKISDVNACKYNVKKYNCFSCPLGCGAIIKMDNPKYPIPEAHRPEYETLSAFGPNILNDNLESIMQINDLCNRYGLDSIGTGSAVAWAFEAFEKHILTREDTGGLVLAWGNYVAAVKLTEMIGKREGLGELLADGAKRAAERVGKGSEAFAMHAGGQDLPMHDPRLNPSFATAYMTDPTPGRHTTGGAQWAEAGLSGAIFGNLKLPKGGLKRYQYKGRGAIHAALSNSAQVMNCLGFCYFTTYIGRFPYSAIVQAVTGWQVTDEELMRTGERIQNLRQAFNVREGIKPQDFRLPDRAIGKPPLESGPLAKITIDIDTMAREYYQAMQWNLSDGRPSLNKLKELGLDSVIAALYPEEK
ncbi:MAG: aldehyde ferredoxin oxidoreductase family protein [Clostridia bacterium]|nr:aldehyde ferredoxin oxidoreductase family protein [Clostridia bacterium]